MTRTFSDRILFLGFTVFALGFFYFKVTVLLPLKAPNVVQLYQPVSTLYYLLGGACLLVQAVDYYYQRK